MRVTKLAFVMPAYDLTGPDEFVPTASEPVEFHVYAWDHANQGWAKSGAFSTLSLADRVAATLHNNIKKNLEILYD